MKIKVRIEAGDGTQKELERTGRGAFTIGRQGADICVSDLGCSRHHALIFQTSESGVFARDLGSRNGTLVNEESIHEVPLAPGDVMKIGATQILFLSIETISPGSPTVTTGEKRGVTVGPPTVVSIIPSASNGWPTLKPLGQPPIRKTGTKK